MLLVVLVAASMRRRSHQSSRLQRRRAQLHLPALLRCFGSLRLCFSLCLCLCLSIVAIDVLAVRRAGLDSGTVHVCVSSRQRLTGARQRARADR